MAYLLGIDIGTSGTKTILCNESGQVMAEATANYPSATPKPGWSEQSPEDWWQGVITSVQAVLAKSRLSGSDISAIGLSGQMHGLVCLDRNGAVLRPAILWNDQRTAAECEEITTRAGGLSALLSMVSNPAMTGFTAPKILWVRKHNPEVYARSTHFLLPKDYIRYRLTGEFATEVSDASGTLLLDIAKRQWSTALCQKLDIDVSLLPKVYESPEISGKVSAKAAQIMGLKAGTPVAGGGGDQAAGAVGNGIVKTGVVSAMMGTSGVVYAHADQIDTDPLGRVHTFCHAVPGKWHNMGVVLAAGGSLQYYRNVLATQENIAAESVGLDTYEILSAQAAKAPIGCEGLFFLPYLTGERTPHADPYARGCFIGLTPRHGRFHLVRAIMEGATFALRDSLEIMRSLGITCSEIRLSGGGARSLFWSQMQADIYGCDACISSSTAGSAYGAMILGGVGTGVWSSVEEATDAVIKIVQRFPANADNVREYNRYYPLYSNLYSMLKPHFAATAKVMGL